LSIDGLVKDFSVAVRGKALRAVDHLSLEIQENEIFGLLGPNGSGKSTTIKAILGLVAPTSGECRVFGESCREAASRRHLGYLPEAPYFPRFLSGREIVSYYAKLFGAKGNTALAEADALLQRVGLQAAAEQRVAGYSKGMLQRLGLAQALVGDPPVIILDEPTAGVDPAGAHDMARLIKDLKARGKTILLCSHLLAQVESICDRVAMLKKGRVIAQGALSDLLASRDSDRLIVSGLRGREREELRRQVERAGGTVEAARASLEEVYLQRAGEEAP